MVRRGAPGAGFRYDPTPMAWLGWTIAGILLWLLWCAAAGALLRGPRPTPLGGIVWWAMRAHAACMLRLRIEGRENVPAPDSRGLIVVANHTSGVDPLLIQLALPFEVRWMMASDMRLALLEPAWKWLDIIFVDRTGRAEPGAVREAIRHVERGGVLGIFPEGGIERPTRHLLAFQAGLGLIVRKTGAPVLPIVIEGTPVTETAWGSLFRRSRAILRIHGPIVFERSQRAEAIASDLRARFRAWTGWPLADAQPRPEAGYY